MNDLQEKWKIILKHIEKIVTSASFDTWFEPLKPLKVDEEKNILYLSYSSNMDFEISTRILNLRYKDLMMDAIKNAFNKPLSFEIISSEEAENFISSSKKQSKKEKEVIDDSLQKNFPDEYYLNPRYNFNNFVVGENNKYAHAAALAVAENPACLKKKSKDVYNPLFIYGGSGLGKTHLMHSIGHYILTNYPQFKVLYVSSEMFTNELIIALRNQKIEHFRKKYRNIDILMIDDIQFLEDKPGIQEEFFHTFNNLYQLNKQIVISSDRPPSKLVNIEERLRSRFQWNMIADIQPPEYENRVAILMKNAELEDIHTDNNKELMDVISLIANKIKSNIRELEGAFTRIITFSKMFGKDITLPFAKEVLKDIINNTDVIINSDLIKNKVATYFNIKVKDLDSSSRARTVAFPRQIAMYLCRDMTDMSLPKIGESFGKRDHSTVMHAFSKIEGEIKINPEVKEAVDNIRRSINDSRL